MKSIKVALINTLGEFNEKKFELSKCKRYKKMAENDYNEIYEKARANFDEIDVENVANIKAIILYFFGSRSIVDVIIIPMGIL